MTGNDLGALVTVLVDPRTPEDVLEALVKVLNLREASAALLVLAATCGGYLEAHADAIDTPLDEYLSIFRDLVRENIEEEKESTHEH